MTFGEKFKEARSSMRMTQTEFGKIFGIDQRQVSAIERGKSNPSKTLVKYFEHLFSATRSKPVPYRQPDEKILPDTRGGEIIPGSYGLPDLSGRFVDQEMGEKLVDTLIAIERLDPAQLAVVKDMLDGILAGLRRRGKKREKNAS